VRPTPRQLAVAAAHRSSDVSPNFPRRDVLNVVGLSAMVGASGQSAAAQATSAYDFSVKQYGEDVSLSIFKDKVTVIVNVASE